jgi:hypothetical protein
MAKTTINQTNDNKTVSLCHIADLTDILFVPDYTKSKEISPPMMGAPAATFVTAYLQIFQQSV